MAKDTKRRSTAQLARDRRREAELYLQGWLQADIGAELGINQTTVSRDLKVIQADWLKSALIDFDKAKAQEIAKVDALERTYHQAWLHSCEDTETVKQRGKPGEAPGQVHTNTVERTRKEQVGDPRFLNGVQWCIEQRCKIIGIYAAAKVRHEGTGKGGAIEIKQVGLTDAERRAAIRAMLGDGRISEGTD